MASAGFVWIQTAEIRRLYIYAPGIGRPRWWAATAAPCGVHLPVRARARATEQRSTSRRPSQPARDLDFSRELWTFDVGDGGGGGAHA